MYEFSVRAKAGEQSSRRTIGSTTTKQAEIVGSTLRPAITRKGAARNAKVLVDVKPVNWDKLNITWKVSCMMWMMMMVVVVVMMILQSLTK